jgi:hypothetical protein
MVVFSGAKPIDKINSKEKFLLVRYQQIKDAVDFLLTNNVAYAGMTINEEELNNRVRLGYLEDLITDKEDDTDLIQSAFEDGDRVDNGQHIHSVSGMFSLDANNVQPQCQVSVATIVNANKPNSRTQVRVINSNQVLNDHDENFFSAAFPDLFPYGIGSPNNRRPTKVSFEQGLKHLLSLRDRRFAQHHCFTLVAFDLLARRKSSLMLSLRLKSHPDTAPKSINVTQEQMLGLVQYQSELRKARRCGSSIPSLPNHLKDGPVQMLKAIEHCSRYSYGTQEERQQMGRKVIAYVQVSKFGIYTSFLLIE